MNQPIVILKRIEYFHIYEQLSILTLNLRRFLMFYTSNQMIKDILRIKEIIVCIYRIETITKISNIHFIELTPILRFNLIRLSSNLCRIYT